jgi:hypothetical protein
MNKTDKILKEITKPHLGSVVGDLNIALLECIKDLNERLKKLENKVEKEIIYNKGKEALRNLRGRN